MIKKIANRANEIPSRCSGASKAEWRALGMRNHFWHIPNGERLEILGNSRFQVCLLCGWHRRIEHSGMAETRIRNFGREVVKNIVGFRVSVQDAHALWGTPQDHGYDPILHQKQDDPFSNVTSCTRHDWPKNPTPGERTFCKRCGHSRIAAGTKVVPIVQMIALKQFGTAPKKGKRGKKVRS